MSEMPFNSEITTMTTPFEKAMIEIEEEMAETEIMEKTDVQEDDATLEGGKPLESSCNGCSGYCSGSCGGSCQNDCSGYCGGGCGGGCEGRTN